MRIAREQAAEYRLCRVLINDLAPNFIDVHS